jgi:hypothetical protein
MRTALVGFALLALPGLFFAACSQETSSAATSTSGTGGAPNCEGVYLVYGDKDGGEPCDICLHDKCCGEIALCRDKACIDCVNYPDPGCGLASRVVEDCLYRYCQPTCSPGWPPTATSGG